ncbi:hypothetical protein [Lysinibacillus fusiformis]|uniref:hypothetical protein n=1 Tax=Lysinibacillus fusiformis TaxID=28031 RepID=UPI00187EBB04|nr:hypothetical protein [Lysinibacillus fusiformis]MBD8523885.1 hypothetical protein [Lysinibacillus fusiformis]
MPATKNNLDIKTDSSIKAIYDPQNLLKLEEKRSIEVNTSVEKSILNSIISIYSGLLPTQINLEVLRKWAIKTNSNRLLDKIDEISIT